MYSPLEKTNPYNDTVIEIYDSNKTSVCSWKNIIFGSIIFSFCAGAVYLLTSFYQEYTEDMVNIAGELPHGDEFLYPLSLE